jgi:putative FmdB family regulatory protein
MPLYEYLCESCRHRFERIQKFSDPPADTCPSCGGGPVRKLLSAPAIQFKGTGWYVTDYTKRSGTDAGKREEAKREEGKREEGNKSGGETKSDSAGSSSETSTKSDATKSDAKKDGGEKT